MHRIFTIFFLIGLLGTCTCLSQDRLVQVTGVKDGDTFEILWKGKLKVCRLANVDAPELKQAFGLQSRDSVSKVLLGKWVQVDSIGKDRYKRMLVSVKCGKVGLDSLMVAKGWAWHYETYSKNKVMLAALENNARKCRSGLWACVDVNVCPPWVYRKLNPINRLQYCSGCK